MLKICVCSDNHGDVSSIAKILNDNPMCDYYFHAGDSCLNEDEIKPFISVKGNNDFYSDFPKTRIIEINNNRILLLHGSGYTYSEKNLINKAKEEKCNIVIFGHTHNFYYNIINNIVLINPGSCFYNRDGSNPCYAIVTIDENNKIDVERVNL